MDTANTYYVVDEDGLIHEITRVESGTLSITTTQPDNAKPATRDQYIAQQTEMHLRAQDAAAAFRDAVAADRDELRKLLVGALSGDTLSLEDARRVVAILI